MKKLHFEYRLSAFYTKPITEHRFLFRFLPTDTERQKLEDGNLFIANCHRYDMLTDRFGNRLVSGYIHMQHARFDVSMCGSVITGIDIFEEKTSDPYAFRFYSLQSALTQPGPSLAELSRIVQLSEYPSDYEKAFCLTERLFGLLHYDPTLTKVGDSAEQAAGKGGGVCQDFAHIMLSLLREQGVTARYAAGMLMGEGGSHAWVEVLCRGYWYGFDPTNRKLVNDEYIRVSCGRDAADCQVISGTLNGEAVQKQEEWVVVRNFR